MSNYQPQVGDHVEVVLRGEISDPGVVGFNVRSNVATSFVAAAHVVSVEKVDPPKPPLPTTPGAAVRDVDGRIWVRYAAASQGFTWASTSDDGKLHRRDDTAMELALADLFPPAGAES